MNKTHCQIIFLCTYFIFSQHLCLFIPLSISCPLFSFPFALLSLHCYAVSELLYHFFDCFYSFCPAALDPLFCLSHSLPTPSPALLSSLYHFGFCCSWQAAAAALKCGRLHGQLVIDGRGTSVLVCVCVRECVWQSKSANSFRKHLSGALCWWFMTARERDRETARQTARNGIESEIERGEWERFVRELEWESVRAFG